MKFFLANRKVIFLVGGLGNNLFQIAHALKEGGQESMVLDTITLSKQLRFLKKWTVHNRPFDIELLCETLNVGYSRASWYHLFILGLIYLKRNSRSAFSTTLLFWRFGYFQNFGEVTKRSIRSVAEALLFQVHTSHKAPQKEGEAEARLSVHIRGTDAKKSASTTKRLIEIAAARKEIVEAPEILTDDPEYARLCIPDLLPVGKITRQSARADFLSLAAAESVIASDSTFCFWAIICGDVSSRSGDIFIDSRNELRELYTQILGNRLVVAPANPSTF